MSVRVFVLCLLDKSRGVQTTITDNNNLTLDTWLIKDNLILTKSYSKSLLTQKNAIKRDKAKLA